MLQENRHVAQIRKWLTRKILDALAALQKDEPEKYRKFWNEFGKAVKEGVTTEFQHKDRLTKLLRFPTSADAENDATLDDYVSRMQEGQNEIYYLSGESRAMCENSPLLEAFAGKGYEVLFLTDAVDELVVQYLPEHDGKKLKSIAKGEVNLGTEEEKKKTEQDLKQSAEEHKGLLDLLQDKLDEHIKRVRMSSRLTESPACLAADEHDMSPQMERLMRMSQGGDAPRQKRILELNPKHTIVEKLQQRFAADQADPLLS